MNRGSNGSSELVSKLESKTGQMDQETAAAARFNGTEIGANALERSKGLAKEISNEADAFNPAAIAAKKGLTGRAAGMAAFYGGSQDPANTEKLQKFSNLYSMVAGRQMQQPKIQKPAEPGPVGNKPSHQGALQTKANIDSRGQSSRGDRLQGVTPLDHMLRSGQIDLDTYYKAQSDQDLYGQLLKKNGYGA